MSGKKNFFLTALIVLIVLCSAAAGGGYIWLHDYSIKKVREIADQFSGIVKMDFKDAIINPFDKSLYIDGVNLNFAMGSSVSVKRIHISGLDHEHRIPRFMKFDAEKVSIPVSFMNFGSSFNYLEEIGYRSLDFDLGADYIYEDGTDRFVLKKLELDGKDLAQIRLGLGFDGLKLGKPGITGLVGMRVYNGGLIWRDHSFATRLIDFMAAKKSLTRKDYLDRLSEQIQLMKQSAISRGNGYAEEFYASLQTLLKNPSTFSLRVEPKESVPLIYLFMGRDFDEILNLYGVRLETGKDVAASLQ